MKLIDKTILITGGTSGIGWELVRQLYRKNRVLVIARSLDRLDKLRDTFPGVEVYTADLSLHDEISNCAQRISADHNSIDVLINNAAIQHTPTFLDEKFQFMTIAKEITLNFTAVCELSYLMLPMLKQSTDAAIVNINSGLGLIPKTSSAVYCATKGAMNIFSQSLRYQLEGTHVRVLQAFMPLVDTPMTEGRGSGKISPADAAKQTIYGIEQNILENYIGKMKVLSWLIRLAPGIARRILKNS